MSAAGPSAPAAAGALYGAPVIGPDETVASIGAALSGAVLTPARRAWRLAAVGALALVAACSALHLALPVPALGAGGASWWIGLAAGCLMISGMLLLAGVEWRCGVGRLAQTAALFGAGIAALFPASVHPLSLAALLAASAGLWGAALLPDLAFLRDRLVEEGRAGVSGRRRFYRLAAGGFRGSAGQWRVWESACRGLALLGILAAVTVLTDLAVATALRSDRHDTLLPVALLVEAVLSGAGLTAALAVALRRVQGLDGLITGRHLDILGRLILAFGLAALYCHVTECVTAYLYGGGAERAHLMRRLHGDEAPAFWTLVLVGLLPSQLFWIGAVRRNPTVLGLIAALLAIGLGADHGLIARSGSANAAGAGPEALGPAVAALCAIGALALGLFLVFRLVPPVSIAETRQLALVRNPGATAGAESEAGPSTAPQGGLAAAFASEAGLSEAVRSLSVLDRPPRLDAFGPVPMPEAAEALHRPGWRLRRAALAGAGLGAVAFLTVSLLALPASDGARAFAGAAVLSWAVLAVPALSAAAAGGTLGLVLALCMALRREAGPAPASALSGRFVLTVSPAGHGFNPAALLRRLNGLPEGAGRPLGVGGIAATGPQR